MLETSCFESLLRSFNSLELRCPLKSLTESKYWLPASSHFEILIDWGCEIWSLICFGTMQGYAKQITSPSSVKGKTQWDWFQMFLADFRSCYVLSLHSTGPSLCHIWNRTTAQYPHWRLSGTNISRTSRTTAARAGLRGPRSTRLRTCQNMSLHQSQKNMWTQCENRIVRELDSVW